MEYLSQRGIAFVAKDVVEDEDALRELVEDHHSRSTPTIVVDGQVLIGLDRGRLEALLN
jgi:glutaredoxin